MLGRLFSDDVIELEVEGADFLLRLASRGDYLNWRRARADNHAFLQPYEPVWAQDALDEDRYRMMARDARRAFRYQSGAGMFLIHKDEGEVIGGINLSNVRRRVAQMGTLGYWMSERWGGQGRMTRAVERMVRFAFYDFNLHRIEAGCIPDNEASARVLLNAGFREEGYAEKYLRINGAWQDHRLFGITRPEDDL